MVGKMKETAGKLLEDDDLEFKGKMQTLKADIGNKVENLKDEVLEKTNDFIDKMKDNKSNKH